MFDFVLHLKNGSVVEMSNYELNQLPEKELSEVTWALAFSTDGASVYEWSIEEPVWVAVLAFDVVQSF